MEKFNDVYEKLKDILDDEISMENLTSIVLKVIQLTEKIPADGPTKKKVALSVINKLITDSKMENKSVFLGIVSITVPPMIDCLVDVDRRKIVIKKTVEKSRNCMEYFCI